ncbi:MAG: SAM-dependent methyltransferase, partial [Dehalococcoidia bacterium]
MAVQVYFIGAGPGDPELLTLKGKRIIEQADVIIYADSLVDPGICSFARSEAEIYKSASMSLE